MCTISITYTAQDSILPTLCIDLADVAKILKLTFRNIFSRKNSLCRERHPRNILYNVIKF